MSHGGREKSGLAGGAQVQGHVVPENLEHRLCFSDSEIEETWTACVRTVADFCRKKIFHFIGREEE